MEGYVTEEQQWEALKKWFKQYGDYILWAAVIVSLTFAGVKYWLHHREVLSIQASDQYLSLMAALEKEDEITANSKAEEILKDYQKSPYATLAALLMAKQEADRLNWPKAIEYLQWIRENSVDDDFKALATVRLMRVRVDQGFPDEALALYSETQAGPYLSNMAEIKGDILLKQDNKAGAVMAYEKAYRSAPAPDMVGPFLKIKCENLGIDLEALGSAETVNASEMQLPANEQEKVKEQA